MNPVIFPVIIALLSVFGVMVLGVISMVKGGTFNEKYGNRLMKLRVFLQGLVVIMLALAYYLGQ